MARAKVYVGKPCAKLLKLWPQLTKQRYVGASGKPAQVRIGEHQDGYKASKFARRMKALGGYMVLDRALTRAAPTGEWVKVRGKWIVREEVSYAQTLRNEGYFVEQA